MLLGKTTAPRRGASWQEGTWKNNGQGTTLRPYISQCDNLGSPNWSCLTNRLEVGWAVQRMNCDDHGKHCLNIHSGKDLVLVDITQLPAPAEMALAMDSFCTQGPAFLGATLVHWPIKVHFTLMRNASDGHFNPNCPGVASCYLSLPDLYFLPNPASSPSLSQLLNPRT